MRKLRVGEGDERNPQWTLDEAAASFDGHKSKLSRIERGLTAAAPRDIRALLAFYGVEDAELTEALLTLARGGRRGNWWTDYRDVLPRQFTAYLGLEAEAEALLAWQPNVIPGLLQTAGYARGLVLAHRQRKNEEEATRLVEARMERQAILQGPNAPLLQAIIGEGALHRMVGGRQVMHEQLTHLAEVAEQPNVQVQVLPYSAGAYTPEEGGFQVLRFADTAAGEVVCVDLLTRTLYVDDKGEVLQYRDAWEDVLGKAAPHQESIRMIMAAAEEMK
ncbi:helix-turn-helix transcriptional regulator [Actinoplanes sp. NPDC026670]|uniref:helix-turn-helix domain-containing protein n=1 Tax=Actinoplanes sp. NPDC026670 TaxID=3154700 RepID=UPI0033DA8724